MSSAYFDLLADFIEEPQRAAESVRVRCPWGLGVLSFAVAGASLWLARAVVGVSPLAISGSATLMLGCLWQVFLGAVTASVFHLLAEAGGGRGSVGGLFVLLGLSSLVWTVALPAALILRALFLTGWPVTFAFFAALGLASFRLKARSIQDNYGIGRGKAWLVLISPYILAALAFAAVVAAALAGLVISVVRLLS